MDINIKIRKLSIKGIVVIKGMGIEVPGEHVTKVIMGILAFTWIFKNPTGFETVLQLVSSMLSGILGGC